MRAVARSWHLEGVCENATVALFATDERQRCVYMNPAAEALTGYAFAELRGRTLHEAIHHTRPDGRPYPPEECPLHHACATGGREQGEDVFVHKDGHFLPIAFAISPVREGDAVVGTVVEARDLSAERRAADQREALHRALAMSEERYRLLATTTSAVLWLTDAQGAITVDNSSWQAFTGQNYAQYAGRGWLDAVHPDDRARVAEAWERVLASGEFYETEYRLRHRDGCYRRVVARGAPVRGPDGAVREWVGHCTDVQAAAEVSAALRESEERYRVLSELSPQIVWMGGADGYVSYFNQGWVDYTGLGMAESVGEGWAQALPPDQREPQLARWREAVRRGEGYEIELPLRGAADGQHRWHLFRGRPVRDGHGRVTRWVGVAADVHAHRQAGEATARQLADERAVASRLQRLAAAALTIHSANTPDSVLRVITEEARRLIPSHQAVSSLTLNQDWAQTQTAVSMSDKYAQWRDYRAPPDGGIYAQVCRANRPMRLTQAELEAHPDWNAFGGEGGRHPPMRGWLAVPFVGRNGANIGLIQLSDRVEGEFTEDDQAVLVQLATVAGVAIENSRLYQELREGDRRKDEFLATLAHELRNPLAPLRYGLQIMRMAADKPETVERARDLMDRQLTQLVRLVDDLMDVSRISRGKLELKKEAVALDAAVAAAVEATRPLIEASGHQLVVRVAPGPLSVEADPTRLTQILGNLLNNAAKYTPAGGRIEFSAEYEGDAAVFRIRDSGIGIPAEQLGRVFDMFAQVERSLERSQGGLGIGLTLVKRLTELHAGRVEARSEGVGRGSEFIVRLPRTPAPPVSAGEPEPGATTAPARRVLVVDDNQDAANALTAMLTLLGNEVRTAYDGPGAVDAAGAFRPDVVLLDIGLPGMSGYEVARRLRQTAPAGDAGPALVAVTGWGQDEDRRRSREAGFDQHLVKPVDLKALQALLTSLAEGGRPGVGAPGAQDSGAQDSGAQGSGAQGSGVQDVGE